MRVNLVDTSAVDQRANDDTLIERVSYLELPDLEG